MKIAATMVLAAGRGERMQPLTNVLPKPALPLIHRPVIASAIQLAVTTHSQQVVVNTWYMAQVMERALTEVDSDTPIAVSRETELMDTAGGIALARERDLLGDRGPVMIVNGDCLLNLDLNPLFERMTRSNDLISLALLPHLDPRRWSHVVLDQNEMVSCIRKPGSPLPGEVPFLYTGVMLVAREALNNLAALPGAIPECLWEPALAEQRLGGAVVSGHWREIGTPPDYLEAVLGRLDGNGAVHPSADVHPSTSIGSALIGRGARIAEGAVVGEAIVAEGATVGRGARVLRSVLLGDVAAEPGEVVVDEFRASRP